MQKKDLNLRLTLNKIFGVALKYSIKESPIDIGCSDLFNWALRQLFVALSSTSSLIQSSSYMELSGSLIMDALQKYRWVIRVSAWA